MPAPLDPDLIEILAEAQRLTAPDLAWRLHQKDEERCLVFDLGEADALAPRRLVDALYAFCDGRGYANRGPAFVALLEGVDVKDGWQSDHRTHGAKTAAYQVTSCYHLDPDVAIAVRGRDSPMERPPFTAPPRYEIFDHLYYLAPNFSWTFDDKQHRAQAWGVWSFQDVGHHGHPMSPDFMLGELDPMRAPTVSGGVVVREKVRTQVSPRW